MQEACRKFFAQFAAIIFSGDPDGVFAARVRPPVEPAVARVDGEAGLGEERVPALRLEPPERHRRRALRAAHREGQRLRLEIPVGALVDPRLALDPAAVRLLDVLLGGREDVEDEPAAGLEQLPRRAERLEPLLVRGQVEIGPERAGDERDPLVHGRPPQIAEPQVEARATPGLPRPRSAQTASIPADESTPITFTPASAVGIAIRPVPTPSSTTGPAAASASST